MVKEINFLDGYIEFIEENKGLFRLEEKTYKIDLESIDKVERLTENNKLIGFILWERNKVLYAIGFKNYDKDLDILYDKVLNSIKRSINITETEL